MKKIVKVVNFNMNNIELINPYYTNVPIKNFSDLDEKLNYYYDYISDYDPRPPHWPRGVSPRALLGDFRSTSRDIFYYISWLYDNNPESVIDFGCGECYWKKWFPNIFGVDIDTKDYSKMDLVIDPDQFIAENQNKFDCGMALNSIHFGNLSTVINNIHNCMMLIKPLGRFLFTINIRMLKMFSKDSEEDMKTANIDNLYKNIKNMPYNIVLLDVPKEDVQLNGSIRLLNGSIRFILEQN